MDKTYILENREKTQELLSRLGYGAIAYETENIINANMIKINRITREVFCNDKPVDLTCKEYELLLYLVRNTMRIVYRDEIINRVWGYEYNKKSRTLDIHIRSLRQKLGEAGAGCIKTIRNVGYRFIIEL